MLKTLTSTFAKRNTDIQSRSFIYNDEFIRMKMPLWRSFLAKINQKAQTFPEIIDKIHAFIEPVLQPNNRVLYWNSEKWTWQDSLT